MTAQQHVALLQRRWNDAAGSTGIPRDDIEKRLRAHLIADAAGMADGEDDPVSSDAAASRPNPNRHNPKAGELAQMHALHLARIAMDVMAPNPAKTLTIIGSGEEAETHMSAALDSRDFADVRIYARQPVAASKLAKKFRSRVQKPIEVCASPEQAVHNADVIILATGDAKPIIDSDWLLPEVHITCAFPEEMRGNELPATLLTRAKIIASDCPQLIGANRQHLMSGLKTRRRVIHLGAMIDRFNPDRQRGMTLFFVSGVNYASGADLEPPAQSEFTAQ